MLGTLVPYAAVLAPLRGSTFIWKAAIVASIAFNVLALIAFFHWRRRGYDHLANFMLIASLLYCVPILVSPLARARLMERVEARIVDRDLSYY